MNKLKRITFSIAGVLVLSLIALAGTAWYWAASPANFADTPVDYIVESGQSPRAIARTLNRSGIALNEDAFVLLARLSGRDKKIKAGAYEALQGDSPWRLLERMANGEMNQARITLVEGWTTQRILEALHADPQVRDTLSGVPEKELLERLGSGAPSTEGLFYPDTYVFVPGTTDFDLLRRAHQAQADILDTVWQERDPALPLGDPYDALILASIIEKETGHTEDRRRVSGVFVNRLRRNMPLQTDPTVIYGLGEAYAGRLRKKDLTADTPWNTYTRSGLPPTPISNPGRASLLAAVHPERHDFLYFVSRGDGTSEFSRNLPAHNRAVAKYILKREP